MLLHQKNGRSRLNAKLVDEVGRPPSSMSLHLWVFPPEIWGSPSIITSELEVEPQTRQKETSFKLISFISQYFEPDKTPQEKVGKVAMGWQWRAIKDIKDRHPRAANQLWLGEQISYCKFAYKIIFTASYWSSNQNWERPLLVNPTKNRDTFKQAPKLEDAQVRQMLNAAAPLSNVLSAPCIHVSHCINVPPWII